MVEVPAAEVPPAADGERVDRFIALVFECSRAEAVEAIRSGTVSVDGETVAKPSLRILAGQVVVLSRSPRAEPAEVLAEADVEFDVLYEDADLVVVDKPVGLVVHPGAGNPDGTLCNGLVYRYPEMATVGDPKRPGIVHRLDRATSGLMVTARSQRAYEALVIELSTHEVKRRYSAVVWGHPDHDRGVIDAPIGRSKRNPLRMTVTEGARSARTHFAVRRRIEEPVTALLDCDLETGRTHQIRVHMASIGHPVLGDEMYGHQRDDAGLGRMFLHAAALGFTHPGTGAQVEFASDLPEQLSEWLEVHSS